MLRVLIVAFDGMQPSQVSPATTPHIYALARRGTRFTRHHSVFPTVTRVNAASMVTGMRPGAHGLAGNTLYAPEADPDRHIDTMLPELTRLSEATGGKVLLAPGLGELLAPHGMSYAAVIGGTAGNAFMHYARPGRSRGALAHPEFTHPASLQAEITGRFGRWPPKIAPSTNLCRRVADVFLEVVRPQFDPTVALLWFPEPDNTQHDHGVGSPLAMRGLAAADEELGRVLAALHKLGDDPVVFVISDHGYSTISHTVDVERELSSAGFVSGRWAGGVVFAPNGGAGLLYVPGGSAETADQVASWLAGREWVGAMLSCRPGGTIPGLLPGERSGTAGARGPDIAFTFRWHSDGGANGYPGTVTATNGLQGRGTHGSGSPQELRATLIAAGPGVRMGTTSDVPTGQQDIVPTVFRILGLPAPAGLDGRPAAEAFADGPDPAGVRVTSEQVEATRPAPEGPLRQRMDMLWAEGRPYVSAIGRAEDFPVS